MIAQAEAVAAGQHNLVIVDKAHWIFLTLRQTKIMVYRYFSELSSDIHIER